MAGPKVRILVDILEEHFEELQLLWELRQAALRSPRYDLRAFRDLDGRLEAHVQGLLVGGEACLPLVEPALMAEEPLPAFAAAYTLLRLDQGPAALRALRALKEGKGGQLAGIGEAFCQAFPGVLLRPLKALFTTAPGPVSAAAAEVLTWHASLDIEPAQWVPLLRHDEASVRQTAWRTIRLGTAPPAEVYQVAFQDKSPAVRREALLAAAWTRRTWLLDHLRNMAIEPAPDREDALWLLAMLGKPQDLELVLQLGRSAKLGPMRFRILGAYGHPASMDILLPALEDKDPRSAVAAAAAFTKITGADIDSGQRVTLPPADGSQPDEFEKEFLDEVDMPSSEKARAAWQKDHGRWSKGTRICRGLDLSQPETPERWDQLDMESRWEAYLRGAFERHWEGWAIDLEKFPQN